MLRRLIADSSWPIVSGFKYSMIMTDNNAVAKTIKTYEETAEDYYKTHFDINEVKNIADFFIQNLKGQKILDIGCGPGRDAKYFSEHGLKVTGADLTSNFVKMASQNVPNAKFVQMDMRNLGFPENTFDGIWACASFLHVPKCIIRPMPTSDSDGCRPPIPGHADHLFRWHGVHFLGDTGIRGC
ncbi:MAG: methyltransferase domain-containing protein, partial [Chloroflexota bacterium]